jgi:phosphatidylethanolamine/phosphatidyl-N-methylethanolamine N-methyltransferase
MRIDKTPSEAARAARPVPLDVVAPDQGSVLDLDAVLNAYRRYAGVYDVLFGPVMEPGRRKVVRALDCRPGDRILEVGVGTGLSLPLYPQDVNVVGIDVSRPMLERARRRVARQRLRQVEAVQEMDAQAMEFGEASFDKVVAMYVVSVVPDPRRAVEEMRRVCKPGGEIFIVNHFRSAHPMLRLGEGMLAPLSKLAGFRPDLDLHRFLSDTGLTVLDIGSTNLFGYWKVIRCRNGAASASPAAAHAG